MKTIAERVKWAREQRGMTCAGLDEVADLSCGHAASIERGRRENPSTATLVKIAIALEVDFAWLALGGKMPATKGAA